MGDVTVWVPAEWAGALDLSDQAAAERTGDGVLIRPRPRYTWDDVFATRLTVRRGDPAAGDDDLELTGDDFLF